MTVVRSKTWSADEVLTADELNAEFNNILDNQQSLGTPRTAAFDMNGLELILDADADTSITADTDDQIDVRINGADVFVFTASGLTGPTGALLTPLATTSGTTKDFTITPWAKKIDVVFVGVSTNGTSRLLIRLGDAGGIEDTSYVSAVIALSNGSVLVADDTNGFGLNQATSASDVYSGVVTLTLENSTSFTWACSSKLRPAASIMHTSIGTKSLSAALTTVRITTVNGTDAFDAGEINVQYS